VEQADGASAPHVVSNVPGQFCFNVGQVGNLQPIVNRLSGAVTNRAQDAILPTVLKLAAFACMRGMT